ncbi:MAG: hypothetical protein ACI4XF_11130 [Oscillospiraceae bacterium]
MNENDIYSKIHGYNNALTDALCSGESILCSGIQKDKNHSSGALIMLIVIIVAECLLFYFFQSGVISIWTMILPAAIVLPVMTKRFDSRNEKDGYALTDKRVLIYTDGNLSQVMLEDITDVCIYSVKGKIGTLEIYKNDLSEKGKTVSVGIIRDIYLPEEIRSAILLQQKNSAPDR